MEPVIPIDPELLNDPLFQRVMEDALSLQERFSADPVYARTGKGFLQSVGVAELDRLKRKRMPDPACASDATGGDS